MTEISIEVTDEGLFFKGQYFEPVYQLHKILSKANSQIKLVDNYLSIDLIKFICGVALSLPIKILTNSIASPSLILPLTAAAKQYKNLEIKGTPSYHDRFIILDDKIVYHFGASLKDLGNKTFMFSRIEQQSIINSFVADFDSEWVKSSSLV
jgi:hypothetical protein